jgi:Protein of unknown function (DUF1353)
MKAMAKHRTHSNAFAAVIHDYLYWTQSTTREAADNILRAVMEELRVDSAAVSTIHHAVDLFGGQAWEKAKSLKANGERRILSRFPDDDRTTWEEWKKQNVFQ